MSMNEEEFASFLWALENTGLAWAVDDLRARDTAQREALGAAIEGAMKWEQDLKDAREALARVEAERDRLAKRLCICHSCGGRGEVHTGQYTDEGQWQPPEPVMVECGECGGDGQIGQVTDLDTAQAQLAEAAGLLRKKQEYLEAPYPYGAYSYGSDGTARTALAEVKDFLARHAQAEQQEAQDVDPYDPGQPRGGCKVCKVQQEAQGAQAGDRQAKPGLYCRNCGSRLMVKDVCSIYCPNKNCERDRAALATQPAASEPAAWECFDGRYASLSYEREGDPDRAVPLFRGAPPAAAHGDDTCRIDWLACTWRLGGKLPDVDQGSFREVIDAAMRAQGDDRLLFTDAIMPGGLTET